MASLLLKKVDVTKLHTYVHAFEQIEGFANFVANDGFTWDLAKIAAKLQFKMTETEKRNVENPKLIEKLQLICRIVQRVVIIFMNSKTTHMWPWPKNARVDIMNEFFLNGDYIVLSKEDLRNHNVDGITDVIKLQNNFFYIINSTENPIVHNGGASFEQMYNIEAHVSYAPIVHIVVVSDNLIAVIEEIIMDVDSLIRTNTHIIQTHMNLLTRFLRKLKTKLKQKLIYIKYDAIYPFFNRKKNEPYLQINDESGYEKLDNVLKSYETPEQTKEEPSQSQIDELLSSFEEPKPTQSKKSKKKSKEAKTKANTTTLEQLNEIDTIDTVKDDTNFDSIKDIVRAQKLQIEEERLEKELLARQKSAEYAHLLQSEKNATQFRIFENTSSERIESQLNAFIDQNKQEDTMHGIEDKIDLMHLTEAEVKDIKLMTLYEKLMIEDRDVIHKLAQHVPLQMMLDILSKRVDVEYVPFEDNLAILHANFSSEL